MKLKNLAFCGVMASILGVGAASADTIIASKAYVDAQTAPKENSSNKKNATTTAEWTTLTQSATKNVDFPTVQAVENAISGLNTAIGTGALSTNALEATGDDVNKITKASAIQNAKEGAQTLQSGQTAANYAKWTATGSSDVKFPTQKAVAQQLEKLDADAATTNVLGLTGDDVHKLAKAEAIQAAASSTQSATYVAAVTGATNEQDNHPAQLNLAAANSDGNTASKFATTSQVRATADQIQQYVDATVTAAATNASNAIDGLDVNTISSSGQAIVSVGQSDGRVSASYGTITYQEGLVNTLKSINNATADASCSTTDPCMLTYIGTSTNGTPQFRWTNLATESLTADTTTTNNS